MKVENDHRSKFFQLKKSERRSLKKDQGFNVIRTRDLRDTGAILYLLSNEVKWCEVIWNNSYIVLQL